MRTSVERDALAKALSTIGRVVPGKPVAEVMGHVLIQATQDAIAVTGADMEIRMSATVPAEVAAVGTITLPAAALTEYANRLPAGSRLSIELVEGGQRVALKSGRSRATMVTLNPDVFPILAVPDAEYGFEIEGQTLAWLLSSVDFAVRDDLGRPFLAGVFLHVACLPDGPVLRTAGSDGLRTGRARAPCPRGADGLPEIIIPKRAAAEIKKLAAAAGQGEVVVALSRNEIQVSTTNVTLVSKLIDAVYPDLDRLIPREYDKVALADAAELTAALSRAAIATDETYRSSRLSFTAGTLEIVARNTVTGDVSETVDIEYAGPDFVVGFNNKLARDVLGALASDTVQISCGRPGSPTLWTSPADPAREYVLMPLMV